MPVRHNIFNDAAARDGFVRGVLALNREPADLDTAGLGIPGPNTALTTWDLFVLWHYFTMQTATPPGSERNAAHRAPVFLPWHRWMLLILETQLQRVLNDADFGLPYWDWTADGDQPATQQPSLALWQHLGGTGFPVADGPFAFDPNDPRSFRVRVAEDVRTGQLQATDRGLWRDLAQDQSVHALPTSADLAASLGHTRYDDSPYDRTSIDSFRNHLEGWRGADGPGMHNRVHVWVGGDMGPGTSPNDPVFYLNHCNVDRLWEAWMTQRGRHYQPDNTAPDALFRQRLDDPLLSSLTEEQPLISQTLDLTQLVDPARVPTYDALPAIP